MGKKLYWETGALLCTLDFIWERSFFAVVASVFLLKRVRFQSENGFSVILSFEYIFCRPGGHMARWL